MGITKQKPAVFIISIILLIIAFSVAFYSVSKIFCFMPTTTDENAYIFGAKLFLRGKFYVSPPQFLKDFFYAEQIVFGDKWFPRYPPGHYLVLIPGVLVGFYNLMPIVLSAFTVVIVYFFVLSLTKNTLFSAISGIVTISSPFFICMSGTLTSFTSSGFFILMYLFILYKNKERGLRSIVLPILLGLFWSFGFITRQYSCLLITLPFVIYHMYLCVKFRNYKNFIFFIIGSLPLIILLFIYNYSCTGNPLMQTYTYYDPTQKLGFGMRYWGIEKFTPKDALKYTITNMLLLNKWLFGLPFSFFFVFASIFLSKNDIWKVLLTVSILMLIGGYFFFFYPGTHWMGPNYYYELAPILIILFFRNINNLYIKKKYILLLLIIPFCLFYYPEFSKNAFSNIRAQVKDQLLFKTILKEEDIHNAMVFIEGELPIVPPTIVMTNSPFFDNDILVAHNKADDNISLMLYFPTRKFYRFYFTGDKDTSVISEIKIEKPFKKTFKTYGHFGTKTGKRIFVPNSENFVVYGRKQIDNPGNLVYGPYFWFPKGDYKCIFYIKADKMDRHAPIAKLDIAVDLGNKVIAERILHESDFEKEGAYCKFTLDFTLNSTEKIETRVYFYGNSNLCVKQIQFMKNVRNEVSPPAFAGRPEPFSPIA